MATSENLKTAFAGESQANRKYLAFARKAEQEGFPQVARLFRAAAEAETVHAHSHLRVMEGVKGTAENLEAAIAGEAYESDVMYPQFIAEAEQEGHKRALRSFKDALAVEKIHRDLYTQALNTLKEGKDLAPAPIYVCSVCGCTLVGSVPDHCPVCNAVKEKFSEVK